jgi:surface antigen
VKTLAFLAALGVVLTGCAPVQTSDVGSKGSAPPPPVSAPRVQTAVQPGPWRITKTEWSAADEEGFGRFVRAIAESGCTTTASCMQSAANPYRDSDPASFVFHADCAKWVYMLRAYYASKNGLPFSYVDRIASEGSDPRFSTTSNSAVERKDIVDAGMAIDAVAVLKRLHDEVSSATYRMDPVREAPLEQDFYSPKIAPGAIRAGTAIYDINGHVMLVYDVTEDGSILYMDANPDQSVSRGIYGPQVPQSRIALGGGFKNFRPLKLEGAQQLADGTYIGGHVVLAANDVIPDFSLEQYRGNVSSVNSDGSQAEFRYNNASLNLYQYARASMSRGSFAYNPVYELQVSMNALCQDAIGKARGSDARIEAGITTLYADLSRTITAWEGRDLRVVYNELTLKDALMDAYAAQNRACAASADKTGTSPLERYMHRSPQTDVQRLIADIVEPESFAQMKPVGR